MKRTSLLIGMLCLSAYAQAQQYWLIEPKNEIKWNVPALATHSVSLQYERALGEKTALALGLTLMPAGKVPLAETIRDYYLSDASNQNTDAANDFAKNAELSGWAITPEFRFYTGKKPHQGFYLAPYLRYARYSFDWNYTFMDQDKPRPSEISGILSVAGGGLMIGHKWHFNKILMDWWILGLSYNSNHLNLDARSDLSDLNKEQQQEQEGYVEDISVNGHRLEATLNSKGGNARGGMPLPGIRMGLCFGLRF